MKKFTAEEEQDIEERTTALGMFNVAESYWRGAAALRAAKVRSTHPESPVSFLYYHAIELYLKSFLRLHGHKVLELAGRKFGHKTCCLRERAEQLGLKFPKKYLSTYSLMATTDAVIRSRYIQTGFYRWPTIERLDEICKQLREPIGQALKKGGFIVRL